MTTRRCPSDPRYPKSRAIKGTTIESDNGYFRAIIGDDENDDGWPVALYTKKPGELGWKPIARTTLDAPLHVLRDHVFRVVNQLQPDITGWPTRLTVLEIVR